jgi:carbon-monoxide dehydrogenase medium subunit
VKPAAFEYHCPRTLDEALTLLAEHGDEAKPLAGGQSLIPAMNFRLATPAVLIDLNAISELAYIDQTGAAAPTGAASTAPTLPLRIGAMTRHRALERSEAVARRAPLIRRAMPYVAHEAIRTRGTIGGSLAHADPAAELPAVMLALNAQFTLTSRTGARTVAAHDFFHGLFATALETGELLTEINIPPLAPRTRCAFQEIARRHGDYALAGVAALVSLDDNDRVLSARLALLSVGDRPILAAHAAEVLIGETLSPEVIRAAAEAATRDVDPPSDIHASARYRRHLVQVLSRRALEAMAHEQPADR